MSTGTATANAASAAATKAANTNMDLCGRASPAHSETLPFKRYWQWQHYDSKIQSSSMFHLYEALESVNCDIIKICPKRRDATRNKIK